MQVKTFAEYVTAAAARAGSDAALGRICGLADGSRIGGARRGDGPRLSELACVKMARFTQDDPLWVLDLAGYGELADLLRGVATVMPQVAQIHKELRTLRQFITLALEATGGQVNGETEAEGDPGTSGRMGSALEGKRRQAAAS
jgi:hypothetical protein